MEVDPQKVIEILGRRIASEVIANAVQQAAFEKLQEQSKDGPQ